MKEREPTQEPDAGRNADRPAPGAESLELSASQAEGTVPPEQDLFDSLGATRVSFSPTGGDSDEALAERSSTDHEPPETGSRTGTSSRRGRNILGGEFQLVRKLGQGAMASVYKARQLSFDRNVALKLLHKHIADNPKLVQRFFREARTLFDLDHPNLVQGYAFGELDGFHYFAMEYVSGANLQAWLNKLGRIPVPDAVHIAIACAKALGYAHDHGLIHRDVKPDNVLITKHGQVKVADLGMVKALDEEMTLTQTGHAVGTPWYMPLEQAKNAKDVDGRCDIYALGCMLYYMITGRPPFRGASIVEVIQAKEIGTFPPARQFNSDVPDRLDLIMAKMTAKQARHRYQHCREVIHDLEELMLASSELTFPHRRQHDQETPKPEVLPKVKTPLPRRTGLDSSHQWYIMVRNDLGETMIKKTTEQLLRMLEMGQLSPNAKVSRQENTGFRSLATYKEFESVALALATRTSVDKHAVRYRELYKKLEETDFQREEKKLEAKELDQSIQQGVRMAAIIGGAVVGAILLLWLIFFLILPWFTR